MGWLETINNIETYGKWIKLQVISVSLPGWVNHNLLIHSYSCRAILAEFQE